MAAVDEGSHASVSVPDVAGQSGCGDRGDVGGDDGVAWVTEEEVLACQIQRWYPLLRGLSIPTEVVSLPETFVDFLQADGLFLPESSEALPSRAEGEWMAHDDDYKPMQEDSDSDEEKQCDVPSFPQLAAEVNAAIRRLGGSVMPKLNWSSPKDTGWISPSGSMRCSNAAEVFLLLKASDNIAHDLCHAFNTCRPESKRSRPPSFVLALRKWSNLRPEMEFRCFVTQRRLVGISQREVTNVYPSVHCDTDHMAAVKATIIQFFSSHMRQRMELSNYAADVYVTSEMKVKVVDINTFGGATLPLLFSWQDLLEPQRRSSAGACSSRSSSDSSNPNNSSSASSSRSPNGPFKLSGNKDGSIIGQNGSSGNECGREGGATGPRAQQEAAASSDLREDADGGGRENADYVPSGANERSREKREDECGGMGSRKFSDISEDVELRVLTSAAGVRPGLRVASGAPFDLQDSSEGGAIDELIGRLAAHTAGEESSDDEGNGGDEDHEVDEGDASD